LRLATPPSSWTSRAAYLETAAPIDATPQDFRMEGSLGENWLASLLTGCNGSGGDGSLQADDGEVVAGGAAAAYTPMS
jgi:hypothetical protein